MTCLDERQEGRDVRNYDGYNINWEKNTTFIYILKYIKQKSEGATRDQ